MMTGTEQQPAKQVFLVTAFGAPKRSGVPGPVSGQAEQVLAVIGIEGERRRFEWVGDGPEDSVANPAVVTPVTVDQGIPSPWHPDGSGIATGLVELGAAQLGTGPVDDDLDHLLAELAHSRDRQTDQASVSFTDDPPRNQVS